MNNFNTMKPITKAEAKKEQILSKLLYWCNRLNKNKWWRPSIVEKILVCHYISEYNNALKDEQYTYFKKIQDEA